MKRSGFRALVPLLAFMLAACGSSHDEDGSGGSNGGNGSGNGGGSASTVTLGGTAAAGAPIVGQVMVKGAAGNTRSALIDASGHFSVDVTGLTAPYRLRAEGTVGGRSVQLHSYAEAADGNGTVNITPFTDLIVANAARQIAAGYFDLAALDAETTLDPAVLTEQESALQAKLQAVFDVLGVGSAVDLLHTAFSADHSGLDAALDILSVEVDTATNVATIRNVIDNAMISDSLLDPADNTDSLTVSNADAITTAADDVQAIAAIFRNIAAAFAAGLPDQQAIQDYFAADFYTDDVPRSAFLTGITTDPTLAGLTLGGVSVADLNSMLGTATVTFHVGTGGFVDPHPETWLVIKDPVLGWQARGDGRIADTEFGFHCNDPDGTDTEAGVCGINTRVTDNDFTNNGTVSDAPVASATVTIIDGADGATVKGVIYLGTPEAAAPGGLEVYDEAGKDYVGDWKAFGTGAGRIDAAVLAAGDLIEYNLYVEGLDLSNPAAPRIATGAVPVATYRETLPFAPTTTGSYPVATETTLTAMASFRVGDSVTLADTGRWDVERQRAREDQ